MAPLPLQGPVLASFLLFALLSTTATASSRALLGHSSDIVPDVSLSDDAVGERKVLVDVSTVNGAHYNLAVFEYKLNALGEDDGGETGHNHVSKQCKDNSKVALVRELRTLLVILYMYVEFIPCSHQQVLGAGLLALDFWMQEDLQGCFPICAIQYCKSLRFLSSELAVSLPLRLF
jgi:hypothetical protein